MRQWIFLVTIIGVGCQTESSTEAAATTTAAATAAQPAEHACAHQVKEGCACGQHDKQIEQTATTTRTTDDGKTVFVAGQKLADATANVSLVDLVDKADTFVGKTVQLRGNVGAMCHHKRGWFAVTEDSPQGRFVRVVTAPVFLVPEDAIGKTARLEGTVEVVDVSKEAAQYFATGHKLGDAGVEGPTKHVVIRATGAEFM